MKRYIFICLIVISSLFVLSMGVNPAADDKEELTEVTGLVEVYSTKEVFIVEKWTSRSRISLLVTGDMFDEVKNEKDKILTVNGIVKRDGKWSGSIDVREILDIQNQ